MKVCIIGCGAIGGLLAAHLAATPSEITVLERGKQFEALRDHGLVFQSSDGSQQVIHNLNVVDDLRDCGVFDVVFLAVKAHEIASLAADIPRLFSDHTVLVSLQNGIPWWYFQRHGGDLEGRHLKATDPDGALLQNIDSSRILGCVAYPAAEIVSPGLVRHVEGVRFPLGELDGMLTQRASDISELLISSGLKSPVLADIRSEIWLKAWGNLAFNPISALTGATMAEIVQHSHTRDFVVELMTEAQSVADKLGVGFRVPLEQRIRGAEKVGGHKTSMLQDILAKRPLELNGVLGSVIEIAGMVDVSVPNLKGLYALGSLRNDINLEPSVSL